MTRSERIGTLSILGCALIGSFFPIVAKIAIEKIPPFLFSAVSVWIVAGLCFMLVLVKRRWFEVKQLRLWPWHLLNSVCNNIFPLGLFYLGIQYTSGLNAAILLLSEIPFTVVLTPWFGEKTTRLKILSASFVLLGSGFVLWQGGGHFNIGDVLIFLSPLTYPIGNVFGKRLIHTISVEAVIFCRAIISGILLTVFSLVFEPTASYQTLAHDWWWIFLLNGFFILGLGKYLWFIGLRLLDVSKSVMLAKTEPLFSLVFVVLILHENVTRYQFIGILVMFVGLYFTIKRPAVSTAQSL